MNISKKISAILSFFLLSFVCAPAQSVTIKCMISECESAVSLYEFNGFYFEESIAGKRIADNLFEITLPKEDIPRVYFIGSSNKDVLPIIVGTENMVTVSGKCGKMRVAQIDNSLLNSNFESIKKEISRLRSETIKLTRQLRTIQDEEGKKAVFEQLDQLDQEKLNFLDSLEQKNPFFAKTVAINTYLSYPNNMGSYNNEIMYFADKYFAQANFKDEVYNYLPWLTDAVKAYTQTLARVGLDEGGQKIFLDRLLRRFPEGSKARQLALAGIVQTYQTEKGGNFIHFGEQFIEEYKNNAPAVANSIQEIIDKEKSFMIGGKAPDFVQMTPDGEELHLSDLKGKVVLIDFWASWCGPCRRENPNVVRLYNEYKDKGFEIIGVSLDRKKDKWLQAIEQDELNWLHVSDLKGWKNEVAQMYSVSSIPYTVLLDREGKIIGKRLRGTSLEKKLKEIFSEGAN